MKKITLIFLMLFIVLVAKAQLQEEDFGSLTIPSGWTEANTTSCAWQFGYTGDMPGSGGTGNEASFPTGAALFDDSLCGALSEDRTTLTGPSIDLAGVTNVEIEVVYNLQVFGDKGEFYIEVFDGSSWQEVYFQEVDTPRNTGENQTVTLDVSTYINSAFAVRFIYDDEGISTVGLGIDHYKLNDNSVTGINELAVFGFEFSPNPVVNILRLKSDEQIKQINVYNILGQRVLHHEPSKNSVRLNMGKLPMGSYIVHVQIENKVGSFKILKQ